MTTATLQTLKFVTAVQPASSAAAVSPEQRRRNALAARISEQLDLANAMLAGKPFEATRVKTVKDEKTGEMTKTTAPKRVKAWFWQSSGRYLVTIRYGASPLTFAKNTNAVEAPSLKAVVTVLTTIKTAALSGELDAAIGAVVSTRKSSKKQSTAPVK